MAKFRKLSLKVRLWCLTAISLLCLLIFSGVAYLGIIHLRELAQQFYQHSVTVSSEMTLLIDEIIASQERYFYLLVSGVLLIILALLSVFVITLRSFMQSVNQLKAVMAESVSGGRPQKAVISGKNEIMDMAVHYNVMVDELGRQMWRKDVLNGLSEELAGRKSIAEVANKSLAYLSRFISSGHGGFYVYRRESGILELVTVIGQPAKGRYPAQLNLGEGIIGQAAQDKKPLLIMETLTESEMPSALSVKEPRHIYAFPLVFEQEIYGVIELASCEALTGEWQSFLAAADRIISTNLYSVMQNERIQLLFEKSEKASQYKSQFLANMSHELRTPLNSIILLSKIMLESKNSHLAANDREKVEVINHAGNDLLALINDILDISKIEAGKIEFSPQMFTSSVLLDTLQERFAAFAVDRHIQFVVSADDSATLYTDREKLSRILINFLANAFKFTEQGTVWLRFYLTGEADFPCAFLVKDSGIGISMDDQLKVFEAFKQVDGSTSRKYGGTGLGLYICTQLAETLGGKIQLKSQPGEGSEFLLFLPAAVLNGKIALAENTPQEISISPGTQYLSGSRQVLQSVRMHGKKILIVDDDPKNVFVLAAALEEYGAEILEAVDSQGAMVKLAAGGVDLILMDVMLPGINGYQTIATIRSDAALKEIPIIVVTARALPGDREKSLQAGADDYLAKPVDYVSLIEMVQRWLSHKR